MGREKHKNLSRGIKQPLVVGGQRVRASRHGKPHTHKLHKMQEVLVVTGTPNAKRSLEAIDPKVTYPAGTIFVDGMAIVHRLRVAVAYQAEVKVPFERLVAAGPTGTHGRKNEEPNAKKGAGLPARGGR